MSRSILLFPVALMSFALAGCANDPYSGPKQDAGTVFGALTGALIGSSFGGGTSGHIAGAVAGAAVGGVLGNAIGASLDARDRQRAYAAQMQAIEYGDPGAPVGWRSPDSGWRRSSGFPRASPPSGREAPSGSKARFRWRSPRWRARPMR